MSQAAVSPADPTIPMHMADDSAPDHHNLIGLVLKAPKTFARLVAADRFGWRSSLVLLAAALGFYSIYGAAMGVFSGGSALWMTGLKIPLIAVASSLLCAPSLYVLLGLNGSPVTLRQSAAILAGSACLTSLLLVGFAPVAWLFGVSTSNLQFMIVLHLAVWGVGLCYGLRLLGISVPNGYIGNKVLVLWTVVFLLVSSQMATYFRPLLTLSADGSFHDRQKQFFFQHLVESVGQQEPEAELADAPNPDVERR